MEPGDLSVNRRQSKAKETRQCNSSFDANRRSTDARRRGLRPGGEYPQRPSQKRLATPKTSIGFNRTQTRPKEFAHPMSAIARQLFEDLPSFWSAGAIRKEFRGGATLSETDHACG
jgi:hypothetical protein